ncbi:MAG TPA: 7TM-DISM domain-containing protein, partial [Pseudomonadales bacterium]|nr:7TM-DISM domain-containing protein [Pseudomonadales bacterium]
MTSNKNRKLTTRWTLAALLIFFLFGLRLALAEAFSNQEHDPQGFLDSLYYVKDLDNSITEERAFYDSKLEWQKPSSTLMNFGLEQKPVWIKFKLAKHPSSETLLLEIAKTKLNSISVWLVSNNNTIEQHYELDGNAPIKERFFYSRNLVFPLTPSTTEDRVVLLRLQTLF